MQTSSPGLLCPVHWRNTLERIGSEIRHKLYRCRQRVLLRGSLLKAKRLLLALLPPTDKAQSWLHLSDPRAIYISIQNRCDLCRGMCMWAPFLNFPERRKSLDLNAWMQFCITCHNFCPRLFFGSGAAHLWTEGKFESGLDSCRHRHSLVCVYSG